MHARICKQAHQQDRDHEGHIAEKGFNPFSHHNLVHKLVHMSQAMKLSDTKTAVDKECRMREFSSMARKENQKQNRGHRARKKGRQNSSFVDAHGLLPLEELGIRTEVERKF